MTTPVITALTGTSIPYALELLRQHGFKALPVVNEGRRVMGIVTHVNLFGLAPADVRRTLCRQSSTGTPTPLRVADHMKTRTQTIVTNALMLDLVSTFASADHHHILVPGADGQLADIATEPDLVGGLYRQVNTEPQAV